jgi:hypothetical protein
MAIQYSHNPYVPPINSYGGGYPQGGYDFGYGGGAYGWDPRAGYVPYGGGYSTPTTHTVVQPIVVKPPQQVGQQYINTTPRTTQVAPAPKPEDFLKPNQAVEKWGDSERIVAKDAPEGFKRNLLGALDWATFGIGDFDRRGNLYGGVHKPGLRPGSGYGGKVSDVPMPQPVPSKPPLVPNQPLGDPRVDNTGQWKHFGSGMGLSQMHHLADQQVITNRQNQGLDYMIRGRQALDPINLSWMLAQQATPYGKSYLMDRDVARTQGLTNAAVAGAQKTLTNAQRIRLLKDGAIAGSTAGMAGSGRVIT